MWSRRNTPSEKKMIFADIFHFPPFGADVIHLLKRKLYLQTFSIFLHFYISAHFDPTRKKGGAPEEHSRAFISLNIHFVLCLTLLQLLSEREGFGFQTHSRMSRMHFLRRHILFRSALGHIGKSAARSI